MGRTSIEWTDFTFNPWWGCVKVSPACDHCYAETFARRLGFSAEGREKSPSKFPIWGKDEERRTFNGAYWHNPHKWNRQAREEGARRRVFCASMADVMEDNRKVAPHRERLWELIADTPHLDWLLLTKRPQNFRRFLPSAWREKPRPNVWLMTTVESNDYRWRIDELARVPAVVRGISYEPALGPLHLRPQHLAILDWVIAGGESGTGARPANPEWFRSVRDRCAAAGVPFLFKQWGEWSPISKVDGVHAPPYLGFSRDGKKAAGRLLDGREHNEFPIPKTV